MNEHVKAGVVRQFTDEDYNNLSEEEIKKKYVRKNKFEHISNAPCDWSKVDNNLGLV